MVEWILGRKCFVESDGINVKITTSVFSHKKQRCRRSDFLFQHCHVLNQLFEHNRCISCAKRGGDRSWTIAVSICNRFRMRCTISYDGARRWCDHRYTHRFYRLLPCGCVHITCFVLFVSMLFPRLYSCSNFLLTTTLLLFSSSSLVCSWRIDGASFSGGYPSDTDLCTFVILSPTVAARQQRDLLCHSTGRTRPSLGQFRWQIQVFQRN